MLDGCIEIGRHQSVAGVEDDLQLLEALFADVDLTLLHDAVQPEDHGPVRSPGWRQ